MAGLGLGRDNDQIFCNYKAQVYTLDLNQTSHEILTNIKLGVPAFCSCWSQGCGPRSGGETERFGENLFKNVEQFLAVETKLGKTT